MQCSYISPRSPACQPSSPKASASYGGYGPVFSYFLVGFIGGEILVLFDNLPSSVDNSMLKMKVKNLESQVDQLKRASVDIQAQVRTE